MIRKMRTALVLILLLFGWTAPSYSSGQARQFLSGLEAYKKGDYSAAIAQFNAIAQKGVVNGKLYYNLGNAYLKDNDLGSAILWYERALKFMPDDPDLHFNLDYARSLTKDVPEETVSPLVRIFFFWKYQLSDRTIKIAAIAINFLFWMLLCAWRLTRRRGLARAAMTAAIPALIFVLTAGYTYYETARRQQAIVLPKQTAVRSGLENTSTQLFILHAGAKVRVVKQLKGHYQIRFSADKIGWVGHDVVGLI